MWLYEDNTIQHDINIIHNYLISNGYDFSNKESYILWRNYSNHMYANWLDVNIIDSEDDEFIGWVKMFGEKDIWI